MLGLAHIGTPSLPYLNGGPGLVKTNQLGEEIVRINNRCPAELEILKDTQIGFLESICPSSIKEINSDSFINKFEKCKKGWGHLYFFGLCYKFYSHHSFKKFSSDLRK